MYVHLHRMQVQVRARRIPLFFFADLACFAVQSRLIFTIWSRISAAAWPGLLGARDAARDGDQHPFAIFAQTGFQRGFQLPALCADAGSEEPQVRRGGTDTFHRVEVRGADDESDVVFGVPCLGELGDIFVEMTLDNRSILRNDRQCLANHRSPRWMFCTAGTRLSLDY